MKHIKTLESFLNESLSIKFNELWKEYKSALKSASGASGPNTRAKTKIAYLSKYFNNPEEIVADMRGALSRTYVDLSVKDVDNMEKEILKYLQDGITINGNPNDGYTVFTIRTQHFKISSLDELSVERFEKAISDFKKREELENELLKQMEPVQHDLDWRGFIDGKYDTPKQ